MTPPVCWAHLTSLCQLITSNGRQESLSHSHVTLSDISSRLLSSVLSTDTIKIVSSLECLLWSTEQQMTFYLIIFIKPTCLHYYTHFSYTLRENFGTINGRVFGWGINRRKKLFNWIKKTLISSFDYILWKMPGITNYGLRRILFTRSFNCL